MTPDQWARVKTLFGDLSGLDPAEWPARLSGENDEAVVREVTRLLAADRSAGGFLEDSPADALGVEDAIVGRMLGPFRIGRLLGEGGSGRVHLAEREDVGGRVAVKLLRGRFAGPDVTRRFQAEQAILARLDHPNIARLLQVGVAEDGTPWLAMEYVEGEPFRDAMRALPLTRRVEMVVKLLDAVDYAHRQLVVHRDIKPGNILVDRRGEPRLLDFGIAKRLDDAGADRTATFHQPRTPAYAAPEQVLGEPVSVATDVYAMGVLLYEVLTGSRPWTESGNRLDAAILAGDAELPSSRATGSERRALEGDLDAIVMQAMHRDPRRRYSSAAMMAADLRRHLESKPVGARRQTPAYRAGRFLRRNHRWVAAGVVVAALLGFGILREHTLRNDASIEAGKANQVADFMLDMFDAGDSLSPDFTVNRNATVFDLMRRAETRLDALDMAPLVRAELAHKMGQVYWGLSEYDRAERLFSKAIALREKALGDSDATAESYLMLGRVYSRNGQYRKMLAAEQRSYDMRLAVLGPDATGTIASLHRIGVALYYLNELDRADAILMRCIAAWRQRLPDNRLDLADSLTMHAHVLLDRGLFERALDAARETLTLREAVVPPDHPLIAESLSNIAHGLFGLGRHEEAVDAIRKAGVILESAYDSDHRDLVLEYEYTARYLLGAGDVDAAGATADKAIAMATRLGRDGPFQVMLDRSRQVKVEVLRAQGNLAPALALERDVLRTRLATLPATHTYVIASHSVLADLLRLGGERGQGDRELAAALSAWRAQTRAYTPELVESIDRFAAAGDCGWLAADFSAPMPPPMSAAVGRARSVCAASD